MVKIIFNIFESTLIVSKDAADTPSTYILASELSWFFQYVSSGMMTSDIHTAS